MRARARRGVSAPGRVCLRAAECACLLLLVGGLHLVGGEVLTERLSSDGRALVRLHSFGYGAHGSLGLRLAALEAHVPPGTKKAPLSRAALLLVVEAASEALEEEVLIAGQCPLEQASASVTTLATLEDALKGGADARPGFEINQQVSPPGAFALYLANCDAKHTKLSLELRVEAYNVRADGAKDYLSVGESTLPLMYVCFAAAFSLAAALWARELWVHRGGSGRRGRGTDGIVGAAGGVRAIHWLMLALVCVKTVSLLTQAMRYRTLKVTGGEEGWLLPYFVFRGLSYAGLFITVILIASGWSFLKPFLAERDKRVLMVVLPLQVFAEMAIIMLEETAPSDRDYFEWTDLFHLVDLACCCAILFPIVWQIKHLREAAATDGKAARALGKLELFRGFYVTVVAFIYFTRIVVYLVKRTAPYESVWVAEALREGATLLFYATVGLKFRPVADNPYTQVEEEELRVMETW
uniref:Protein GPR107 n=1 Tax=Prasinoderma singulare TaxID=676789 RepID=A0A7S3FEW2_9VIRI